MHNKNLWSPWRYEYVRGLDVEREQVGEINCQEPNFIAGYFQSPQDDEQNLVIHRTSHGIIFLNRYPYANGHLLVALGIAKSNLLGYDDEQRGRLWELVDKGVAIMHEKLRPQGVNIGINEGQAGGAGVPQHLHAHIVPRWSGDTNFMSTIGEVRVIPSSLEEMYKVYSS